MDFSGPSTQGLINEEHASALDEPDSSLYETSPCPDGLINEDNAPALDEPDSSLRETSHALMA